MASPARDDSDQAGTTTTPSADEHSLAVVSSRSNNHEQALKRGWPALDGSLDERAKRRDAEWHERLDSFTQDIERQLARHERMLAQHERMLARHERMLQNLAPLIPWARAVFVRQRYELSQDFILSYRVWLRRRLPRHVTDRVPDRDLLDKLKTLSVSQRDALHLNAKILALASLARFLLHYLADQLRIGAHYPYHGVSQHDFIDFAAPLVGREVAQDLVNKLSRITIQPEAVPDSAQWVVSTPAYEHKDVVDLKQGIEALHERFVEAWRTNRFPFEEESEEAVRYFNSVATM